MVLATVCSGKFCRNFDVHFVTRFGDTRAAPSMMTKYLYEFRKMHQRMGERLLTVLENTQTTTTAVAVGGRSIGLVRVPVNVEVYVFRRRGIIYDVEERSCRRRGIIYSVEVHMCRRRGIIFDRPDLFNETCRSFVSIRVYFV